MRRHLSPLAAALCALVFGAGPSAAGAQVDTARVRVTKERAAPRDTTTAVAGGEVSLPRDTAARPAAATPRRRPAFRAVPIERYMFGNRGFSVGLGMGAAMPAGTFRELGYDPGFHASVPIAWQRPCAVLGARATLSFDKATAGSSGTLHAAPGVAPPVDDPRVYAATLDALVRLPLLGAGADRHGVAVYGVAGGGGYAFRDFGAATALASALGAPGRAHVSRWGVNAGGGVEWGFGPTAVFVEGRWVNVFADGSRAGNRYLRWVPVTFGLSVR